MMKYMEFTSSRNWNFLKPGQIFNERILYVSRSELILIAKAVE